ncbi:MAG TPA: elongation factor P, partial [Dehalococcoidia bacterium]|nr:elongation factor P [Dehalococcoidia bacterium]
MWPPRTLSEDYMIETGDLKKGSTIEIDGNLYTVIEVDHLKIGRGSAQVRMKLRDVRAGHIIDKSVQAGTRFTRARVERQAAQYLYPQDNLYYFMNTETYDQFPVGKDILDDALDYIVENGECNLLMYGDEVIGIELPAAVTLEVTQTDPGERGNTAQGGTKPAKLETGKVVQVPLFINTGDRPK